ncbi:BZ3500_MvSof-1268-A1-R1_Chr3-2g06362 [Microbotryum saponariae]|uniref:BZ3500_MvSof-1268-A1-R1_Chr3-2g06362 protein n=1 Tax=Microbotryum saponariae TaxID=289078 RepID=A0A2X0LY07_9BASI|nr:BZ3500_MvSof-1268-A1-R1_Chr3-2g06362 [Microbotryum saponariae]SDA04333.1 BZ3501_MvSof-1269-A2-R1_Chr3-2g06053 [Microbotryum saponariae]
MHLNWCLAFASVALAGVADASSNGRPFVMPRAVTTTTSFLSVKTSSKITSSSNTGSSSAAVTASSSQLKSSTTSTGNATARVATSSTTTSSSVTKTTTTAAIVAVAAAPTATPVCAQSKFYNVALKQCANCQTGAKSCSNATTATACLRNYYLSGSSCVATCPDGSWGDASSFKCIACTDNDAATCSKAVPGAITCKTKYAYKGTCVAPCPDHFRMEPSNRTCMACSDPDAGDCTPLAAVRCLTKFLSNGKCVDTCPDAKTFADAKWHTCTPCPADSTSCDAKGLALGCATKFLSLGACVDSCPTNSYTNLATKTCNACADGVLGCSATGDTSCGTTVAGVKLFLDSLKSKCVPSTSCSTRFFGNSATGKCEKCAVDGALTCMPATVALTCGTNSASVPTFLSSGSCVASCPAGFYGQSGKCLACGANALTCDATGAAVNILLFHPTGIPDYD